MAAGVPLEPAVGLSGDLKEHGRQPCHRFGAAQRFRAAVSSHKNRPLGLKPHLIRNGLRGPEGPLFHG